MRNLLTFIAVALVTALTVALVAPSLIDWSARREMVARAIALRIGTPVSIRGAVALRLLPTPRLEIADVSIGPPSTPWMNSRSLRLELGVSSLFGGRLELTDLVFDAPELRLRPDFRPFSNDRPVAFEHLRVRHATLRLARNDEPDVVVADLNFDGAARGAWRGAGDFSINGLRCSFQIASDGIGAVSAPIKAAFDSEKFRADFDGEVSFAGPVALTGSIAISGNVGVAKIGSLPWRIAGRLSAGANSAEISDAETRLGVEARSIEAGGRYSLQFGAHPSIDAQLTAKTLNFDSLLRGENQLFVPPVQAVEVLSDLVSRPLGGGTLLSTFSLSLRSEAAYVGARTLEATELTISGNPSQPMRLEVSSGLPGRGRIKLDGLLELGRAPIFRGRSEGEVGDFGALAAWVAEDQPSLSARLATLGAALPEGRISGAADLEASPDGVAARRLSLEVATSRFDGSLVYRWPSDSQRGRFFLDLATDALDIAAAPNVEAGLAWLGDTDLDFRLKANTLRVARVGLASMQGGSLVVRAEKDGAKFTLDKLSLANLGGASIEAEGETSPSGRWLRLNIDAAHLSDFSALLGRVAPSPYASWFQQHADDLGAAKATFEARRDGPPLSGAFSLDFLKADGEIAGSRLSLTLSRAPAPVGAVIAQAVVDAPDAAALLRRLGLKLPPGSPGRAELSLNGLGSWERGFEGKAELKLAGTNVSWQGSLQPETQDGELAASGPLTIKGNDIFPALAVLGFAPAGSGIMTAVDLSGELRAGRSGARFEKLAGALQGANVKGELTWASSPEQPSLDQLVALSQNAETAPPSKPSITGDIEIDRLSLGALLSIALGRSGLVSPGVMWATSKFGPSLLHPPKADLGLRIGALDLGFATARSASARLLLDGGQLALSDANLPVNGGRANGHVSLSRQKAHVTASGALNWKGVALEPFGLRVRLDGGLDFAGGGDSAGALMESLAGAGEVHVVDAKIPLLDAEGFGRALKKIEDAAGPPPDERRLEALIGVELNKAPLPISDATGSLALSTGLLRFGGLELPLKSGAASLSGALNLSNLTFGTQTTLISSKVGPFWSGPPPSVDVTTENSPSSQIRKIEVSLLSAGLAAEAIARESDRIANFEADVRERAAFNRRRKAELFLTRREAEIAAFNEERERRRLMDYYFPSFNAWAASHSGQR